jgi:hypothetical protein
MLCVALFLFLLLLELPQITPQALYVIPQRSAILHRDLIIVIVVVEGIVLRGHHRTSGRRSGRRHVRKHPLFARIQQRCAPQLLNILCPPYLLRLPDLCYMELFAAAADEREWEERVVG